VIDELAEIGIKGWYSTFLVVLADLGISGIGLRGHCRAELREIPDVIRF
jgi:hypothetical protein